MTFSGWLDTCTVTRTLPECPISAVHSTLQHRVSLAAGMARVQVLRGLPARQHPVSRQNNGRFWPRPPSSRSCWPSARQQRSEPVPIRPSARNTSDPRRGVPVRPPGAI